MKKLSSKRIISEQIIAKKLITTLGLISLVVFLLGGSLVTASELTGNMILKNVEQSRDFKTATIDLKMKIYNDLGNKRERTLRLKNKKSDQVKKTLLRFLAPADIEGTGLLTIDKSNSSDEEMYLYLPALGSERKISGSQKNGNFMGTDFTYNDMAILGNNSYVDDYNAELKKETDKDYILKLEPKDSDIDYKYCQMWVNKSNWYPEKIEFYNTEDKLEKVLSVDNLEQINGYWTAHKIKMKDVLEGSKTVMLLQKIEYGANLSDRTFTVRNLRRYVK